MGMDAELMAIGQFKPHLACHLDYPAEHYENVALNATVITTVFHAYTNDSSRELAKALGITDVFDFNQHRIRDLSKVDIGALREMHFEYDSCVDDFIVLREASFIFIFKHTNDIISVSYIIFYF